MDLCINHAMVTVLALIMYWYLHSIECSIHMNPIDTPESIILITPIAMFYCYVWMNSVTYTRPTVILTDKHIPIITNSSPNMYTLGTITIDQFKITDKSIDMLSMYFLPFKSLYLGMIEHPIRNPRNAHIIIRYSDPSLWQCKLK